MPKLKEMIIVAFAFVGVVVGAGFATGQEIFQFFTSNGKFSVFGVFITGFIITIGGVFVLNTGYRLRSHNHTEPIKFYLPRTIAAIFDIILTLFLLALAMIMTAGGVSTLHESFGIPYAISSLILVLIILATLFLKFDRLITVLGMVTPFLVIIVTIIAIYYFTTGSFDFNSADQYANNDNRTDKWWWFDAINYGSLQIAAAFSFLSVMGGRLKYEKSTIYGGILGGAIVTFLLLMLNLGMVTEFTNITDVALPSLLLANHISPIIGTFMAIIMILVIYNTVVGLMYAFASRFTEPYQRNYYILIIIMAIVTFATTFIGFIELIGKVFPVMGIFGFILLIPIFIKGVFRKSNQS
ncbi:MULTISPECIES: hypothetical protein [Staphylococcus]|jgi:uncharacterized membrane protein YkvI|uniref:Membrane protein n=1 Tax=Staphylococcus nepalensis TaxID=214473 RepID=A0A380GLW4_9STAP|nr:MULTISPECIES: hypothetical protein [Staphylococcus]VDG66170.1 membrane protein [Lacrimispora indolis]MBO1205560.1 hypothetical protein [Staphylococcus nepalensis]MBO1212588.1 hypothetical protein [Staphylococcus nepalensis]MBO1215968.1 hypothetical protein [Staphylococcus nepalensis]MBO1221025.1 hypothetical protein [Staphylococcus nepalensis]